MYLVLSISAGSVCTIGDQFCISKNEFHECGSGNEIIVKQCPTGTCCKPYEGVDDRVSCGYCDDDESSEQE